MDDAARARRLHGAGRLDEALRLYSVATVRNPADHQLRHDHAVALMQSHQESEAAAVFADLLVVAPSRPDSALALALCLRSTGAVAPARAAASRAVALAPADPLAWFTLGSLEVQAGSFVAAERSLRRCVQIDPGFAHAWHFLGESLQAQERWMEATHAYRNAMRAQPTEIVNIAICAELAGDLVAARAGYIQMCQLSPRRSDSLVRLAQVCALLCEFDQEAQVVVRLEDTLRAEEPEPGDIPEVFPVSFLPLSQSARRIILDRYVSRVMAASRLDATPVVTLTDTLCASDDAIRIGYISADFRDHAVGTLLDGFFAAHDRRRFRIFGYSLRPSESRLGRSLRDEFDALRECGDLDDAAAADLIGADCIDVLFDLSGFTGGSRPGILARRPSPRQIGWLGFIHGHQAPWLDGILMDGQVQPVGAGWPYDDEVVGMPGFMLPSGRHPKGTPRRADFGIPERRVVFASFNNAYKLDVELLVAWVEILRRAPDAYLLIYLRLAARDGFLRKWSDLDGDTDRLIIVDEVSWEDQADRAASCDLHLDAFRYQAGATALACASAGLPVLPRTGITPVGRLSVSMNRFLDMETLVCATTADYIETAVRLADCEEARTQLRREFKDSVKRTGLLDTRRAAAAVEDVVMKLVVDAKVV